MAWPRRTQSSYGVSAGFVGECPYAQSAQHAWWRQTCSELSASGRRGWLPEDRQIQTAPIVRPVEFKGCLIEYIFTKFTMVFVSWDEDVLRVKGRLRTGEILSSSSRAGGWMTVSILSVASWKSSVLYTNISFRS